jgi:hypothetical protein
MCIRYQPKLTLLTLRGGFVGCCQHVLTSWSLMGLIRVDNLEAITKRIGLVGDKLLRHDLIDKMQLSTYLKLERRNLTSILVVLFCERELESIKN